MSLAVLLAAVLGGSARAHVPHDTVVALAAPSDLAADRPWTLLADPFSIPLLLGSSDAGVTWTIEGGAPMRDDLHDAAQLDDGTVAVLAETRLWWRDGDAWDWEELPDPVSALEADGDRLLLAGAHALWSWSPAEGFVEELSGEAFDLLGAGPVAVDRGAVVWFVEGGRWTPADAPGEPLAAVDGDAVYVADLDGRIWRLDGWDWTACGALPEPDPGTTPEILRLAWDGTRLVAAPGWKGPFVSEDGCATWIDRAVPDVPDEPGFGQARTAAAVWRTLAAEGDRWLIGGFFGVFSTEDAGLTWDQRPILSAAATRGMDFSSTYRSDRTVYWGTYGAGVAISNDGGESFIAPSHGLAEGNVQDIRTSAVADAHVITVISGHIAYVSRDGGRRWARFQGIDGEVTRVFPWAGGAEYWLIPGDGDPPLLESLDGGLTWSAPEALIEALDGAQPAGAARCQGDCDGQWRCLTAVNPTSLVCSTDGGATWEVWYRGDDTEEDEADPEGRDAVTEPVLMSRDDPDVVIFGDPAGLHRVTDRGATWLDTELPDDVPVELACAAGDHVFAATRGGAIWRSDDRGQTWIDLGVRMTTQATVMVSDPGFIDDPLLLVANLEGPWVLADPVGSPSLVPWTSWQRIDDRSGFVTKQGCPEADPDPHADLDGRQPLPAGASMTLDLEGVAIRVLGISGAGGTGELRVDGVARTRLPAGGWGGGDMLALVGDLAPGWHRVELVGHGDPSLQIDAVESTGEEGFHRGTLEDPEGGCGCGGAGGGLAAAALALGLAAPRRRRRP